MDFMKEYEKWLASPALNEAERAELLAIKNDPHEIESRFFGPLEFGTAGLRGTMCVGLHQMNRFVVGHATQAFAEVVKAEGPEACRKGVCIICDCRNHSQEFAEIAASILAANGIFVRLFDELRPTPEVSFAVRLYGAQAGINITASHNPKEYNGYKVYWADGAQLPPVHADVVAKKMGELDIFNDVKSMPLEEAKAKGLVTILGAETDELFLQNVMGQVMDRESVAKVADRFGIVYTPFHGTGHKLIPEALRRLGMKNVYCVPEQMVIDGNFPTVKSPNPENPEGFYLAVDLAKKHGCDLICGSDPDADRVGLMVRNSQGEYVVLTGNQTGLLLEDYAIQVRKRRGCLPANAYCNTTIVSSPMATRIAEYNGVKCARTFTGFKFLGEKKDQLEASGEGRVIFSYEESCGYMFGDYVRDKDAVTAIVVAVEMAAYYATQGKTLYDALMDLYEKYGWYAEKTLNLVMPGLDGMKDMAKIMANLHANPLTAVAGTEVRTAKDYQTGVQTCMTCGHTEPMELKGSNVVEYNLADGTTFIIRPSGTEPKIKVYIMTSGSSKAECDAKVAKYAAWAPAISDMK
ncbi:MAG: phospho-sugar mutase [Oscillospiraceae bacterium]|nr:phospho-sugar mutase [Oscillospiraceae bacterium]